MVDVTPKEPTHRRAVARCKVFMKPETTAAIVNREVKKGDVLSVARVAGIQAAKRTSDMIPLCHPLLVGAVSVNFEIGDDFVAIEVHVDTVDRTGVEMEALHACSTAALTVYDMCKSADRGMVIGELALWEKTGGRSGVYRRVGRRRERRRRERRRRRSTDVTDGTSVIASTVTIVVESSHVGPGSLEFPTRSDCNHSSLTHGSTRPPRRRCRLGSGAPPTDAALTRREPTEFVGHRLPASAEHAAEHLDSSHAHDRSPAGAVAAAAPCRIGSARPSAPPSGRSARIDDHASTHVVAAVRRCCQAHEPARVPVARRP